MAYLLVLVTSMIWGTAFVTVKWTLMNFTAFEANALRFFITTFFALIILALRKKLTLKWSELKPSFICSLYLFGLLTLQTAGLKYTTIAKSGFLTTLYAFFTPFLGMIYYKKKLGWAYWLLTFCALVGIFFLGDMNFDGFNFGDFLTVICAVFAAIHILTVEHYSKTIKSGFDFNMYQCIFLGIYSGIWYLFSDSNLFEKIPLMSNLEWGSYLYLAIFSSLIAFSTQVYAQSKIPSHIASMLYLIESPFAAIAGYFLVGETVSNIGILGCCLIIISVGGVAAMSELNKGEQVYF